MKYNKSQSFMVICSIVSCIIAILYKDYIISISSYFPQTTQYLSAQEQRTMLRTMEYYSSKATASLLAGGQKKKIAYCCSADLDVSIKATTLMRALNVMQSAEKHHKRINSLQELHESFSFYFNRGAAAEQSTSSLKLFQEILGVAENIDGVQMALGGNAATMAMRSNFEGSRVLLGASVGDQLSKVLHPEIQVVSRKAGTTTHEDVHLVLEYANQEKYNQQFSPRANRYYLNHDIHNAQLSILEEFEKAMPSFKPDIVVIGGLQLMEVDTDNARRAGRLSELSNFLQSVYIEKIPAHFEFAAVSDFWLFDKIVQQVLPWVSSIGLNEQELHILTQFLVTENKELSTSSNASLVETIEKIHKLIEISDRTRGEQSSNALGNLDRIHFHTLKFHVMCHRTQSKWGNSHDSVIQGALVASKLACSDSLAQGRVRELRVQADDVEVMLPRNNILNLGSLSEITIDPYSPVTTWKEGKFTCSLVPMLACKSPHHTAGLGDNISGAGISYHSYAK